MSLAQQVERSLQHSTQHQENITDRINDPCCPLCYPITNVPSQGFQNFWKWISREIAPSARFYNQNSIKTYETADQIRAILQNSSRITAQTQGIIKAYKNVIQTLNFNRNPSYTAGDLGYFTTVATLLTRGFRIDLDPRQQTAILNGNEPVNANDPLYNNLQNLRRVWASSTTRRSRDLTPTPDTPNTGTSRFACLFSRETTSTELPPPVALLHNTPVPLPTRGRSGERSPSTIDLNKNPETEVFEDANDHTPENPFIREDGQ